MDVWILSLKGKNMADQESDKNIEIWEIKKLIKGLETARGEKVSSFVVIRMLDLRMVQNHKGSKRNWIIRVILSKCSFWTSRRIKLREIKPQTVLMKPLDQSS